MNKPMKTKMLATMLFLCSSIAFGGEECVNTAHRVGAAIAAPFAFVLDTIYLPMTLLVRPDRLYTLTYAAANTIQRPSCPDLIDTSNAVSDTKKKENDHLAPAQEQKATVASSEQVAK